MHRYLRYFFIVGLLSVIWATASPAAAATCYFWEQIGEYVCSSEVEPADPSPFVSAQAPTAVWPTTPMFTANQPVPQRLLGMWEMVTFLPPLSAGLTTTQVKSGTRLTTMSMFTKMISRWWSRPVFKA